MRVDIEASLWPSGKHMKAMYVRCAHSVALNVLLYKYSWNSTLDNEAPVKVGNTKRLPHLRKNRIRKILCCDRDSMLLTSVRLLLRKSTEVRPDVLSA